MGSVGSNVDVGQRCRCGVMLVWVGNDDDGDEDGGFGV